MNTKAADLGHLTSETMRGLREEVPSSFTEEDLEGLPEEPTEDDQASWNMDNCI